MREIVLGLILSMAISAPVFAQTPVPACNHSRNGSASPQLMAARHAMKQACSADRASLCQNVEESCGGPMRCLRAHASQLSPNCASAMRNVQALRASGP